MKALIVFFLLFLWRPAVAETVITLNEWLALNNPKVKQYLTSLPANLKGQAIQGFTLTDGKIILEKAIYEDSFVNPKTGLHLYIFRIGVRKEVYAWVDANGKEAPRPACPTGSEFEHESSLVLSGDIYTWKALQPGDDVVIILCPTEEWLKSVR